MVHFTSAPVPGGAGVTASVDWARRYDLMQQHTGASPTVLAPETPKPTGLFHFYDLYSMLL